MIDLKDLFQVIFDMRKKEMEASQKVGDLLIVEMRHSQKIRGPLVRSSKTNGSLWGRSPQNCVYGWGSIVIVGRENKYQHLILWSTIIYTSRVRAVGVGGISLLLHQQDLDLVPTKQTMVLL